MDPILAANEIAAWSANSILHDGHQAFERKYDTQASVKTMQSMMAQNGPDLEARSGSCLVLSFYTARYKLGMLTHLSRDDRLNEESVDLIKKPFSQFPALAEAPLVHLLTSPRLNKDCPDQMADARQLIESIASRPQFEYVTVTDQNDEISADVLLFTKEGQLLVVDHVADSELRFNLSTR